MKHTEDAWDRYRGVRLASASLGLLLAFLALVLPSDSVYGRGLLLASLAVAAILLLVLTRRPNHQPNIIEILLPIAILGVVIVSALRVWR